MERSEILEGDEDLIESYEEDGIILHSDEPFTLKSGKKSNIYIDIRKSFGHVGSFHQTIRRLKDLLSLNRHEYDIICGVPLGAIPLTAALAMKLEKPFIVLRDKPKNYGTKNMIEGYYTQGNRCILIEDVITTGNSVLEAKRILEDNGIEVVCVLSVVYRGDNLDEFNNKLGENCEYKFLIWLLNKGETFLKVNPIREKLVQKMYDNNSRLIVSVDLDKYRDVIDTIDKVDSNCIAIKLHLDAIYDTYEEELDKEDIKKRREKGLIIMEDRKFADIGHICKKQLKYAWWNCLVDLVTVHCISGESTIQGLIEAIKEEKLQIGLVLVVEMSTDSLIDDEYTINAVRLANKYEEYVVAIVAQHRPLNLSKRIFVMTPGVKLIKGKDNLGQRYRTVKEVKENGSDIVIVGRGITDVSNVRTEAEKYRIESTI